MSCTLCGIQLLPGTRSCPNCGTPTPAYFTNPGTSGYNPTSPSSPYGTPPEPVFRSPGAPPPYNTSLGPPSGPMYNPPNGSNPYGQNPSNPNQYPGIAYGSSSPPSGPGGPNPYANTQPASGMNPNFYAPYAPNPPIPPPAPLSANYNVYEMASPPTIPPAPSHPKGGLSPRVLVLVVLALVVIIGGITIGLISYNNVQQGNANATATAQANATSTVTVQSNQTATAQALQTATAIASTYPFSTRLLLNDPLSDNSKGVNWDEDNFCKFSGNAYHVLISQKNTFAPCFAANTDYTNFTFQAEMNVSRGNGGGLIIRANPTTFQLYKITFYTDGTYTIYVYVDRTGRNSRSLKTGNLPSTVNLADTNTIAVVARGNTLTVYMNQTEVISIPDSTYSHGQIGFNAVDLTNAADVIFTNAMLWQLP